MNNDEFNFKFPNKEDINIDYKKKCEKYIKIQNEYNEKYEKDREDDCNHIMNLLIKSLNDSLLTNENYIYIPIYKKNIKTSVKSLENCKNYKIFNEELEKIGINYTESIGYLYKPSPNQVGEARYDVLRKLLIYTFSL